MSKRPFIEINEEKCDGCGNCVVACAEGAIEIIAGKAKVVNEIFCDGLGACIGHCPQNALKIVEKEVAAFDEQAVENHLRESASPSVATLACGCPGTAARSFKPVVPKQDSSPPKEQAGKITSRLTHWPVQLQLANPASPYFKGANLVMAATCTAFAYGDFHRDFLQEKALVIACPKLDNTATYVEKLANIIKQGPLASLTVLRMEVPCCGGLATLAKQAIKQAGISIPYLEQIISVEGEIKE